MSRAFHRIPRGSRGRAVLTVLLGVLLATAGLAGGAAQILQVAADPIPVTPERTNETSTAPSVQLSEAAPAVAVEAPVVVRRERVGVPSDFPGSLGSAPPAAVAAYQRASAIMAAASGCQLDWTVLAAIGRVESNHGRGPAVGAPLDGLKGRGEISDTDLGELDGNGQWDAPVGPMRLLPATWTVIAVDADDDGVRNPRDLDDAALAAAVLLCAGDRKLDSLWHLVPALHAYHPGDGFVRTVLALIRTYEKQAATLPVLDTAGIPIPVLPDACACTTVRARVVTSTASADARWGSDRPTPSPSATPSATPSDTPTNTTSPTELPTDSTTDPSTDPTDATSEPSTTDSAEPTATTGSTDPTETDR